MVGDRNIFGLRGAGVAGPGVIQFPVFKIIKRRGERSHNNL